MNIEEVRKLKAGDRVYWNDPDDGICSKWVVVGTVEVRGDDECRICGPTPEHDVLECYVQELSRTDPEKQARGG